MSNNIIMSTGMNMAITIFGFVLSALFIMVICCRLLCSRFRQHNLHLDMFQSDPRSVVERSIHGLEPSVVSTFPTIKFNQHIFTSSEDNECTICLGDYKERDILRILPRCGHAFHIACIDTWLRQHHTCPVCRISLQVFSDWTHTTRPLISLAAKARFVPGALPDDLFEQPKIHGSLPPGVPSGVSTESVGQPVAVTVAEGGQDLEAGELPSFRRQLSLRLGRGEVQSADRQQLLEPGLNMGSDDPSHQEACDSSHANTGAAAGEPLGSPTADFSGSHASRP